MSTVSSPAARKIHLKKLANRSVASIPLKSDCASGGCTARSAPATASTASADPVSTPRRTALRRVTRTMMKSAIEPAVSASSGLNQAALRRLISVNWMSCSISVCPSPWASLQPDVLDERVQRRVDHAEDRLRVEAEHDGHRAERVEHEALAPVEVRVARVR